MNNLSDLRDRVAEIILSQGKIAIIDKGDLVKVSPFKWYAHKRGNNYYASTTIKIGNKRKMLHLHRLIMNTKPRQEIDHINGDCLDNRKSNLRLCTHQQNLMNSKPTKGSSLYKGVSWHKASKKWQSYIMFNGKQRGLGIFLNEKDAAKKYNEYAIKYFGEFARLNNVSNENLKIEVKCSHYWKDERGFGGCSLDALQECPYDNGNTINEDTQWLCHTSGYITKTLKEMVGE